MPGRAVTTSIVLLLVLAGVVRAFQQAGVRTVALAGRRPPVSATPRVPTLQRGQPVIGVAPTEAEVEVLLPATALPSTTPARRPAAAATTAALAAVGVGTALLLLLPAAASAVGDMAVVDGTGGIADGFVQAFSLIFVSEIGDKTFFIAALLAAKFSRAISFAGSLGALAVMTFLSVGLGQVFHAVPSTLAGGLPLDDYVASAAFAYFGYRTLKEASEMEDDEKGGELLDAEEALQELEDEQNKGAAWGLVGQTFSLVFAAEFGDRSFLSTIALSAAQNPLSVAGGALVAHTIATVIAILGGSLLSKYISEKVIGYIGGSLFVVFALTTIFGLF